jgi:hypothetical protein
VAVFVLARPRPQLAVSAEPGSAHEPAQV